VQVGALAAQIIERLDKMNNKQKNGDGIVHQVFEVRHTDTGYDITPTGMTLRDWFAGQALAGLLANPSLNKNPEAMAYCAYIHANAMILARKDTND